MINILIATAAAAAGERECSSGCASPALDLTRRADREGQPQPSATTSSSPGRLLCWRRSCNQYFASERLSSATSRRSTPRTPLRPASARTSTPPPSRAPALSATSAYATLGLASLLYLLYLRVFTSIFRVHISSSHSSLWSRVAN